MSWDNHVDQLEHEGLFSNEYLMTRPTQEKLVSIVAPYLQRAQYNSRCSEPILVEHIVAVGIRVLSGGRTKDQRHITGMSLDAAYKAADDSCRDGFWKISEQISNSKWENNWILRSRYKNPYGVCAAAQLHHKRGSAI
jgi:hypothetical protein